MLELVGRLSSVRGAQKGVLLGWQALGSGISAGDLGGCQTCQLFEPGQAALRPELTCGYFSECQAVSQ